MALEGRQPSGRVPHFELAFYPTMESLGRIHPLHRTFGQWDQMKENEKQLHRRDIAEVYVEIARKYEHSAIMLLGPRVWGNDHTAEHIRVMEMAREMSGNELFIMTHGDATYEIPNGEQMMVFVEKIADNPQKVKDQAGQMVDDSLELGRRYQKSGVLDGFALCSDYCFNKGPFLSPDMFDEFITPYLTRLITGYREMGFYTIKHTDGNIMSILDSLVSTNPHALHSLDPQGGIDIAEIKKRIGDKLCLIGNVNCGLLDTGTDEEVVDSVRYALKHGMPGGGYVFATSNCIYTGVNLKRYEMMLDIWRKEGNYPQ